MSAVASGIDGGIGVSLAGSSPAEVARNSGLPERLAALVLAVTAKRGLWKGERIEIARELCGHFMDGLEAGRAPDELAAGFGPPARAARLMLRAKRRNRPAAWRAAMMLVRGAFICFCAVALLYGILAARYFSGSPTLARNYLREINARIEAVPAADRAWPEYRAVRMAMGQFNGVALAVQQDGLDAPAPEAVIPHPGSFTSAERAGYIRSIRPLLDRVIAASRRPALGYVATTVNDVELTRAVNPEYKPPATPDVQPENPPLYSVLLPVLGETRSFVRLLACDATLAAREGDSGRCAAALEAMLRISQQCREFPSLISELVCVAQAAKAFTTLGQIMEQSPGALVDADLARLSHALATMPMGEPLRAALAGEQAMFDDVLQRFFTDDGRGNGRLTPGATQLMQMLQMNASALTGEPAFDKALGPIAMAALGDRAAQARVYADFMSAMSDWQATPPWRRGDDTPDARLAVKLGSNFWKMRHAVVTLMLPALGQAVWTADRTAFERDAACAVLAIELHRRRTGSFPAKLGEVGPMLLPRVPVDPFDGGPIRYALVAGKPVLYSIGVDRKDDGGRVAPGENANAAAASWSSRASSAARLKATPTAKAASIDGDWVIWPPSRQTRTMR